MLVQHRKRQACHSQPIAALPDPLRSTQPRSVIYTWLGLPARTQAAYPALHATSTTRQHPRAPAHVGG